MATFIRLVDYKSSEKKEKEFFTQGNAFSIDEQGDFSKIPGSPIVYWISNKIRNVFENTSLSEYSSVRKGIFTGDNNRFIRFWFEVDIKNIGFNIDSRNKALISEQKWYLYIKGGEYRKWYGNQEFVLNFYKDGYELSKFKGAGIGASNELFYNIGINWTKISSKTVFRFKDKNIQNDDASPMILLKDDTYLLYILSLVNTIITSQFLRFINPTMNFQSGDISRLPIIFPNSEEIKSTIDHHTQQCIDISREEWDSRETSWDFKKNELLHLKTSGSLKDAYNSYYSYWKDKFQKLHSNEVELNRIFLEIYALADEMTPDVLLEDITILKGESEIKDGELVFRKEVIVKQFISYAVGCMFGRYSPDKEGLILANKGETIKDFKEKVPMPSFMPDDENIIPVLEDEYFKDDIVLRFKEFLKVTFGAESLAENLDFIAGALSKTKKGGESSEKIIRDYFLKSFFKDHARTYQKRPIYWLFTSGKGRGFNALVYMHRYDKTLLAKMRTDYLLELEAKLDARMGMLGDSAGDKQERNKLNKQIEELAKYDEVLNNKALEYIDIDLDDGVKVNYAKFEGLVEKI